MGKPVYVLVNPSQYEDLRVHARVLLAERDLNREILTLGLARYQEPPAFSLSIYDDCLYRIAEREARQKRLGIWASAN